MYMLLGPTLTNTISNILLFQHCISATKWSVTKYADKMFEQNGWMAYKKYISELLTAWSFLIATVSLPLNDFDTFLYVANESTQFSPHDSMHLDHGRSAANDAKK